VRAERQGEEERMRFVVRSSVGCATVLAAAAWVGVGCARTPLRTEGSWSRIRAAEEAGAARVAVASLHLQLAKDQLEAAKRLAARGEKEQAVSMLQRANADAELAVALSKEDAERAEARVAVERVRQLLLDNPASKEGESP
jgi:hypothetical protein